MPGNFGTQRVGARALSLVFGPGLVGAIAAAACSGLIRPVALGLGALAAGLVTAWASRPQWFRGGGAGVALVVVTFGLDRLLLRELSGAYPAFMELRERPMYPVVLVSLIATLSGLDSMRSRAERSEGAARSAPSEGTRSARPTTRA